MGDMMNFPKRWEDFLHDYEFEDSRRIYTNGSRLIPSFRVKQMMEHYAPVRHGHWIYHIDDLFPNDSTQECSYCHAEENLTLHNENYCPNCGAKMDEEVSE